MSKSGAFLIDTENRLTAVSGEGCCGVGEKGEGIKQRKINTQQCGDGQRERGGGGGRGEGG